MRRSVFFVSLAAVLIVLVSACKKTEKAESIALPEGAVQTKVLGDESARSIPLLFTLDGSLKDWAGIQPLWDEAGVAGDISSPGGIDIKQVYFKNDAQYLYVFMRIVPTLDEMFKISATGGVLGSLYIDSDNNPSSGANIGGDLFKSEKFKGYEMRIWLPRGLTQDAPYINYDVRFFEGDVLSQGVILRWESRSEGALIAHGPEGVEFALPLDTLRLTLPVTVRVLLREESHWSDEQGHSVGVLTLEAPK